MLKGLCYDDVVLKPRFSFVDSRADVDTSTKLGKNVTIRFPVLSSNMKTVTGPKLAEAMARYGALGVLPRFNSKEEAVSDWFNSESDTVCSIGITKGEIDRYIYLRTHGVGRICIDVAHAANINVVEFLNQIRLVDSKFGKCELLIVGNFGDLDTLSQFHEMTGGYTDVYKILIAPGANCETGVKTGVASPTLSTIYECAKAGFDVIADGGVKNPGDLCKALAAGAKACMIGSLFAGTDEAASLFVSDFGDSKVKLHAGSSCGRMGQQDRTSEGVITHIPYVGSVENVLKDLEGGLRSCMSYLNAFTLTELVENAQFIQVTSNAVKEINARNKVVGR